MLENLKQKFNFKLGTTSYIFPFPGKDSKDHLIKNIEQLAKYFEQIQLLYLAKDYLHEIMSKQIINQLREIQLTTGLDFWIHLPVDLDLLNPHNNPDTSIEIITKIISECQPLAVSGYILHLDRYNSDLNNYPKIDQSYKKQFAKILAKIVTKCGSHAEKIHIENLGYDLNLFSQIIEETPFKICLDIGHLQLFDFDFKQFIATFNPKINLIHLHGAFREKDHQSAAYLTNVSWEQELIKFLNSYNKSLILEVFNEKDLVNSVQYLKQKNLTVNLG
jgi:sugar phosphate isomerase/epimerase